MDANSDSDELKAFMKSILPEYDEDRVYTSDIKKLVKWYELIRKHAPEILTEPASDKPETPERQACKISGSHSRQLLRFFVSENAAWAV